MDKKFNGLNENSNLSEPLNKTENNLNTSNDGENLNNENINEPGYWRSFKELYNDPSFNKSLQNEFSSEALEKPELNKMSAVTRRRFLALMGTSAALAAAGCGNYQDKGLIVPYNQKPEEVTLGLPNYYSSTCSNCSNACGILVKTREGRPIKIDGNPDHPVNRGKICTKAQASIAGLYNPERLKEPLFNKSQTNWADADKSIVSALQSAASKGKSIAIISHKIISPSFKKLLDEFKIAYPTAKIFSYEVFDNSARLNAWEKCFGTKSLPAAELNKAKIILALESDFLGNDSNQIEYTRMFVQNRDVINGNEFNRLYSVEGGVSITGMNADYRLRLKSDAIEEFVLCLLNEFVNKKNLNGGLLDSRINSALSNYNISQFAEKHKLDLKVINNLINDLYNNQGKSFVIGGDILPESTHIAVNLLNEVLQNNKLYSSEYYYTDLISLSSNEEIENLVKEINSGNVDVVIHFDTNPVYHFSPEFKYEEALSKVSLSISLTEELNETSQKCSYVLPIHNQLESWNDIKTRTGFYSLQQPIIAPLYNTRQKEAVILNWVQKTEFNEKIYKDYIAANWEKNIYPGIGLQTGFKKFWNTILHDGVALINEKPEQLPNKFSADAFINSRKMASSNDFVLLLKSNNSVGDGRFASIGWLQELPNPISKVVWDNYAAISVQSAADLGIDTNDTIEISIGSQKQIFPVFVQPGMADKTIEISLGYGRSSAGAVGTGVGVNANILIAKKPELNSRFYNNAKVAPAGSKYELVSTQEHYPIESDPLLKNIQFRRGIIRQGTYEEYKSNPKFLKEQGHKLNLEPINKPPVYSQEGFTGYKWGMSIDLNKCTGCGACVTACNVENNIPVVGKDQVLANREMMWMRIDRYYYGSPDSPSLNFQPMLCQHCDYAPCENVCPVAATTHSDDGLNGMTYNRCVGTRYCSNNCPYKVRRFNYFDFRDHFSQGIQYAEPMELMANPEVTVRSRGVMEKCTFCLQRIMKERQDAIQENRNVIGSNVKTACQEACPAYAIEFGNVNDKDSVIAKYRNHDLGYSVLEEIKVMPNVTYIAKLRNINEPLNIKEEKSH